MKLLFFTATGNSLYIAKSFGGEMLSIPSILKCPKKQQLSVFGHSHFIHTAETQRINLLARFLSNRGQN